MSCLEKLENLRNQESVWKKIIINREYFEKIRSSNGFASFKICREDWSIFVSIVTDFFIEKNKKHIFVKLIASSLILSPEFNTEKK